MLTDDELFEIAKAIDNEYVGARDFFDVMYKNGKYKLRTARCDSASFIEVFTENDKIVSANILGPHTESWQPVQPETLARIQRVNNQ